jgi:hypothetical protein
MSSVQLLVGKLGRKKKAHPSAPLPEALPYPAQVRRRFYLDCAREGHNLRGMFVASRKEFDSRSWFRC